MSKVIEKVNHYYITRNPMVHGGEPTIKGARFPVRSVVFYIVKEGILPEELAKEFPHLSLSAIYDAFSYYYDHTDEIKRLIEKNREELWKMSGRYWQRLCWLSNFENGV